ncbi:hypothetical protein E2C01_012545 [Portunus trituberculatus]|uniref:Uncharacterized protein n=1 Tax=Portunus trituberculatus TaxID=210409 RepID=A0A5B7DF07_PORTR|nr:hypothetical protein [Portunus trituberculatus]
MGGGSLFLISSVPAVGSWGRTPHYLKGTREHVLCCVEAETLCSVVTDESDNPQSFYPVIKEQDVTHNNGDRGKRSKTH